MKKFLYSLSVLVAFASSVQSQNWSDYKGPNGDFSTTSSIPVKVEPRRQDMLWTGADYVGGTALSREQFPHGGCASPIVHNGKVYVYFIRPHKNDSEFDPNSPVRKVPEMFGSFSLYFRHLDSYISGNDAMICMDAATGRTLWMREFQRRGMYQTAHKTGINNHTVAVTNGKVYFIGLSMAVTCLDANTGAQLWEWNQHPGKGAHMNAWQQALNNNMQSNRSRSGNHALYVRNGVVLVPGFGWSGQLSALDANTGALLWTQPAYLDDKNHPAFWEHNGQNYVVCATDSHARMYDVLTGTLKWQSTDIGRVSQSWAVIGDYLFGAKGTSLLPGLDLQRSQGHLVAYRINENSLVKLWEANPSYGYPITKNTGFFMKGQHVYMRNVDSVFVFDINNGNMMKSVRVSINRDGAQAITFRINDRMYVNYDSQHDDYLFGVVNMDGVNSSSVGGFNISGNGISYSSMLIPTFVDSVLYLRDAERISAFDMAQSRAHLGITPSERVLHSNPGDTVSFSINYASSASPVAAVNIYENVNLLATANSNNYLFSISKQAPGVYTYRVEIVDGNGVRKSTFVHHKVLDWEVDMRPDTVTLLIGQRHRLIPLTYERGTEKLLPEEWQPTIMQDVFGRSDATIIAWHDKANWDLVEGGYMDNSDPRNFWGTYVSTSAGTHKLVASVQVNGVTRSDTSIIIVQKNSQNISFCCTPNVFISNGKIQLQGTASSGLPITYTIVSGNGFASISGDSLNPLAPGIVVIRASQPGNAIYDPAADVFDTLRVKTNPVLTTVQINPGTMTMSVNDARVFEPISFDQDGDPFLPGTVGYSWTALNGGTALSTGQYLSPVTPTTDSVVLTATFAGVTLTDTAIITVGAPQLMVSINMGETGLQSTDFAGVGQFRTNTWRNTGATRPSPSADWLDNEGNISPIKFNIGLGNRYTGTWTPSSGDDRMLHSYFGTQGSGNITITNIPAVYTTGSYKLVVYWNSHNADDKRPTFTVSGTTKALRDNNPTWDRVYSESIATTSLGAQLGHEYVVFDNLTADSIRLTVDRAEGASRVGVSGLQIVTDLNIVPNPKDTQSIAFPAIPTKTFGDPGFQLAATATSGLPVRYVSSNTSVATISGTTLTITGGGSTTISAFQDGDTAFFPAVSQRQILIVQRAPQVITLGPCPDRNVNDEDFPIGATVNSGLPLEYTVVGEGDFVFPDKVTLSGDTGTVTIIVKQAGNRNYLPADSVVCTFHVTDQITNIKAETEHKLLVYPNPTAGKVTLKNAAGLHFQMLNIQGKVVKTITISCGEEELDLSDLPKGLYLLRCQEPGISGPFYSRLVLQ